MKKHYPDIQSWTSEAVFHVYLDLHNGCSGGICCFNGRVCDHNAPTDHTERRLEVRAELDRRLRLFDLLKANLKAIL